MKTATVREHPMGVPICEKNPTGTAIHYQHLRRLPGTYLKREDPGLDGDTDIFIQVDNTARSLAQMVELICSGQCKAPNEGLSNPTEK